MFASICADISLSSSGRNSTASSHPLPRHAVQFEALEYLATHEGMDDHTMARVVARHVWAHLAANGSA